MQQVLPTSLLFNFASGKDHQQPCIGITKMNKIDELKRLASSDLNLIIVLQALEYSRNVTKAARSIGLSQSAMSHALKRLRTTFNDELYVKTQSGMMPTPLAESLATQINPLLSPLNTIFSGETTFTSQKLQRNFRVWTTDLMEVRFASALLKVRQEEAPGLQVSFQNVGFSLPSEQMQQGTVDLAIAGFFGKLPSTYYQKHLVTEKMLCCVRKDHPIVKEKLDLETYCELPHVLIAPGGDLSGIIDTSLKQIGKARKVALGTSDFLSAGWAVAGSDAVLTAPSFLIREFVKNLGTKSFEVPIETQPINIVQVWHERVHKDPAHRWFRNKLSEIIQRQTSLKSIP